MNLNNELNSNQEKDKKKDDEKYKNTIILEDLHSKSKYNDFLLLQNNINQININNYPNNTKKRVFQNQLKNNSNEVLDLKEELSLYYNSNINNIDNNEIHNKIIFLENKYNEINKDKIKKENELTILLNDMKKYSQDLNEISLKYEETNAENNSLKNTNTK